MGKTQVIVDIYSRFLFESKVFESRAGESISASRLKNMMIESQKEAYGDALDPNYLHPYIKMGANQSQTTYDIVYPGEDEIVKVP